MQQDMQAHQGGVFTFTAADGTELVLSYRPLMSFDWVLLTLVPANLISYDTDKYILQTCMIISGTVVFFAGGTGHPYFSTDTGVVLRAIEVEADVILLAKAIDGVYDDDPAKNPAAKKYDEVSIHEVIEKNLQVVDMTASILARDNKMPMWVFGLNEKDSIVNTVKGNFTGTKVTV